MRDNHLEMLLHHGVQVPAAEFLPVFGQVFEQPRNAYVVHFKRNGKTQIVAVVVFLKRAFVERDLLAVKIMAAVQQVVDRMETVYVRACFRRVVRKRFFLCLVFFV